MGNEMGNSSTSGLREEDYITEDKFQQEVIHGDDLKAQNHVVSATQVTILKGNAEEDKMKTEGKKSLQDDDRTDDDNERNQEVPASEDMSANETMTGLDSEGVTELHDANQKQDEKDNNTITEAKEKSRHETAYADEVKYQDHLVPADEDQNAHGNETKFISNEPDGIATNNVDNRKQDEKAKENGLLEAACTGEIKAQPHVAPAASDKNTNGIEIGLDSTDPYRSAFHRVDDQKEDEKEKDVSLNDEAKEKSQQEAATIDVVERQDHRLPIVEDTNTQGNKAWLVSSSDSEGTADPRADNPKLDEKEDDNTNAETREKTLPEDDPGDDVQVKNPTIPAAEGADCNSIEAELASVDLMVVGDTLDDHTLERQEQRKIEHYPPAMFAKIEAKSSEVVGEGIEKQPAASSKNLEDHEMQQESSFEENLSRTSHHFDDQNSLIKAPQEPVVLEPEEGESAKILAEQLEQVCNGPLESEDMILVPSLTCLDQENGFILGSTFSTDLPNGFEAKCNGELPNEMNSTKNDSPESMAEDILSDETQNFLLEVSETEDKGIDRAQKATLVVEGSETGISKHSHCQIQSGPNGLGYEEGSNADEPNASLPQFLMSDSWNEEKRCLLNTCYDSKSSNNKECQVEGTMIAENGHLVDPYINYQNECTEEQKKDSQNEVNLVAYPAVISADAFLTNQYKEEESEDERIIQAMVEKIEDSNPIGNDTSRRKNGEQCVGSYPIEQAEAFPSPPTFLHALPEKQQQDNHMDVWKKVQNCNQSMTELKQESFPEFRDLSERSKSTPVTMEETKPLAKQSNEQFTIGETPAVIANGDYYYQRESVGRFSNESNRDNMSIHAQMQKSPSFGLDLRIDARAVESDQTPLLYQDKTTATESFSSQADVTDLPGKLVSNAEYEAMPVKEKVIKLERSDSETSKTPFLKEDEQSDPMLITPRKQDNQSAANQTTSKVSAMEVKPASTKGKQKRKPRTFLFGTCICCATVIN